MKTSMWFGLAVSVTLATTGVADELSLERQREIIERYMYVTGQSAARPAAQSDDETTAYPEKCGTPAILEFQRNREFLDPRLMAALGVEDEPRPVTQASYGIPGGNTLIHYDVTGTHAVWQAGVDSDGDGVPNYVESLALIADSCYDHIVNTLGYPRPLVDSICVDGGDERVDIYVQALPDRYYGQTHNQSECYQADVRWEAAWIQIDHDFQSIPQYVGRPLDAARVTLAHEMFHVVHFAIDATEHITWFEMSSVWMEEEIYDEINDYYFYDYLFFDHPRTALHDTALDGHMYQAVVFPIYLSERYGPDAIRETWLHAGARGAGPHYLRAFDEVIDSASQDPANARYRCVCYSATGGICVDSMLIVEDFASAMAEFAAWNFFTGPYAEQAPGDFGYSEAANYAYIPLDTMVVHRSYPVTRDFNGNRFRPEPNGVTYIRLENLQAIDIDSLLTAYITPDQDAIVRWGVTGIFQMEEDPDSHLVISKAVDAWETWICLDSICVDSVGSICREWQCTDSGLFPGRFLESMLGRQICVNGQFDSIFPCDQVCSDSIGVIPLMPYRSLTLALTPTSLSTGPYTFGNQVKFAYSVFDESSVDSSLVNLTPAVLMPYPNPAVISDMGGDDLTFAFRTYTDSVGFAASSHTKLQLDIYTVAGELVRSLERLFTGEDRQGPRPGGMYEVGWDMRNQAGKNVASGVYLAVARLFGGAGFRTQLAEERVKVAVIR
ncbi:MAG: MXAN_6640 family putative metalloprotease [Candidatus Zixiibacteriota bacterium]